jgi:hypothetical protein
MYFNDLGEHEPPIHNVYLPYWREGWIIIFNRHDGGLGGFEMACIWFAIRQQLAIERLLAEGRE